MRRSLLAALVLLLPTTAFAQQPPRLQIANVRVGYPGSYVEQEGSRPHLFRAGAWTPVFVDIQAGREGLKGNEGRIDVIVETPDPDDAQTAYTVTVPLRELGPNGQFTVFTFAKPASMTSELKVQLRYGDQIISQTPPTMNQHTGVDATQVLYLAVGSRLPAFRLTMNRNDPDPNNPVNPNGPNANLADDRQHLMFADAVHQLPQRWYGYDGLDLVILATGKRDFITRLADNDEENQRRREALAEWVLRGGNLVVCAGRNHDALNAMAEIETLLPVKIVKAEPITKLRAEWQGDGAPVGPLPDAPLDVAVFERRPGRELAVLLREFTLDDKGKPGRELIVQGSAGLGRVTVVGFDLDQRPFTDWKNQADFWGQLKRRSWQYGAVFHKVNPDNQGQPFQPWMMDEYSHPQLQSQLYSYLENFEEVPVISFGWVALFIFIYILVVGPLDYFILKKLVKRLELTWITFPTVVLLVSAVAYFAAYHIKGNDLRIRKVDLVDLDLTTANPQMVGNTWFTLFSPRIQHYTIGVEPAPGTWAPAPRDGTDKAPNVVVSWLGRPDTDRYGNRTRGQSLFRRAYDYEAAAVGLRGVPIQVWSTKSFSSTWLSPVNPDQPLFAATLRHTPDTPDVVGQITWLPGQTDPAIAPELKEAYLIYNNRAVKVPLTAGTPRNVNTASDREAMQISTWFNDIPQPINQNNQQYYGRYNRYAQNFNNLDHTMRALLFFQEQLKVNANERNSNLRLLDQTVRLDRRDEAMLVVRLAAKKGDAEAVNTDLTAPSRLWLGALPGSGVTRPRLDGAMQQDTFVRVYIPVRK
ncbi:MAG: hypothetical protein JNM56_05105 [Planctomycetia bacterium]|nr:hypothetical protein [Planctomycetia bacterium]